MAAATATKKVRTQLSAGIYAILGGKAFLRTLGAEFPQQDKDGKVLLKWTKESARAGFTWCYISVEDRSYSIRIGDAHDTCVEEFELSLEGVAKVFAKRLRVTLPEVTMGDTSAC